MSELNISEFALGISVNEGIAALGILAVSVLAVLVISLVLKRLVNKDGSGLKGMLVDSISRTVLLLVLILRNFMSIFIEWGLLFTPEN